MKSTLFLPFFILFTATLTGCKSKSQADFSPYISGYTGGIISSSSTLSVYLTQAPDKGYQTGSALPAHIMKITPAVQGDLLLQEHNRIEFIPARPLKNGMAYEAEVNLGALLEVPASHQHFRFHFKVIPLSLTYESGELFSEPDRENELQFQGMLLSSDDTDAAHIEQQATASYRGQTCPLAWSHEGKRHRFSIRHLPKATGPQTLKLDFSKEVKNRPAEPVIIPGKDDFTVLQVVNSDSDPTVIRIYMSEKVDPDQDLNGLVTLQHIPSLHVKAKENVIYVYPSSNGENELLTLTLFPGIRSRNGNALQTQYIRSVRLHSTRPAVRFIGKGVIVPAENQVIVPFAAVALKAVDVEIIQVPDQNMNFFLQENTYDNRRELTRTARPVFCRKIDLARQHPQLPADRWNDFTLNLSELVKLKKGVVYRIRLKFKKSYTTLPCADEQPDSEYGGTDWDGTDSYYSEYDYPNGYEWDQRENPCHVSYYTGDRFCARNLIHTDLGLLAKSGADNRYIVCASRLTDASPVSDCRISLYNYQNQKIDSAQTDKYGLAVLKPETKAFTVLAEKDGDRAWLRLAEGDALSLSNFDVSGQPVQMGVKGFIYGERGVWRPGDPIYLSLILEDKLAVLPAGHPVVAQLADPNGNIVQTLKQPLNDNNIHCFTFRTDKNAQTGYWQALFRIGGLTFRKTLRIETVKPNRLAIQMQFPHHRVIGRGISTAPVQVSTRWLNGAQASGQKAVTEIHLSNGRAGFPEFPEYSFSDQSRHFDPLTSLLFEGNSNAEGNFSFDPNTLKTEQAPGLLNATFTTRVFEHGGDFSISSQSLLYSPYTEYVGIRLPKSEDNWYATRQKIRLQGVTVNPEGKLSGNADIQIEVYRLDWHWWWDAADENISSYTNREYSKSILSRTVKANKGTFSTELEIEDYGRYFIRATSPSGHSTGLIAYFGSWGESNPDLATLLQIQTDKKTYRVGETIRLTLPSSGQGTALISQENGKSIRGITRIATQTGSTTYTLPATADMCPNTYFAVTLIQPHQGRDNDRPVRMYGVANVQVEAPELRLHPVAKVAPELRPAKDFTVNVSEKDGKPMNYTVAIVDEGLLSLTAFRTPDPFRSFYAREALGVKTWDFYDYIYGAYGARLDKAFAVGGDEALQTIQNEKTNRFKPVVIFDGPFTLQAGKKARHTYRMPEYIGEIRTMVIAATNGTYGSAEVSSTVNSPLMLSAALPRLFTPGDRIDIPVTVFAMKDDIRQVNVSLQTDDKISLLGSPTQEVNFTKSGEQVIYFKVRVNAETGLSNLRLTATSGMEKTSATENVRIRIPNPRITRIEEKTAAAGKNVTVEMSATGAEPSSVLELSSIPPLNLEQRLTYLLDYPHGCAEQITSQAFPQLSLPVLTQLTPAQQIRNEANIREVINRLEKYQTAEGGFAYWPGSDDASAWVTAYTTQFLVSAQRQGYTVPPRMLRNALNHMRQAANHWNPAEEPWLQLVQAYRLYVLALAQKPDPAAMNRLKEMNLQRPVSLWLLASAYALCRQEDIAEKMIRHLSAEVTPYRETGRTCGSTLRDHALILQSMVLLDRQEDAYRMLKKISRSMSSDSWHSTQETAFALHAAAEFVRKYLGTQRGIEVTVQTAQGKQNIKTPKTIWQQALPFQGNLAKATVQNNGQGNLFVRQITSAAPLHTVTEKIMSGLNLSVRYRDENGKPLDLRHVKQGEDIIAEITVKNTGLTGTYQHLALNCLLPSGFEIINDRLAGHTHAWKGAEYTDIRDDRVYVYFSLAQNQAKTFRFRCNAAFLGTYQLPAIQCSAMYDNSIQAVWPGGEIKIE